MFRYLFQIIYTACIAVIQKSCYQYYASAFGPISYSEKVVMRAYEKY